MDETDLMVSVRGERYQVAADRPFTFGRLPSCTLCLDPDDVAISRLAGEIRRNDTVWYVINRSGSRRFTVVDEFGLRRVLGPGKRHSVDERIRVIIAGARGSHELALQPPTPPEPPEPPEAAPEATGVSTAFGQDVVITRDDRLALAALFSGYLLEGRDYDPAPKSYAAAAARLGWPRTTLVKRVEYIRTRLDKAGVPDMMGWNALSSLAEHALTTGLITRDDLRLIGR